MAKPPHVPGTPELASSGWSSVLLKMSGVVPSRGAAAVRKAGTVSLLPASGLWLVARGPPQLAAVARRLALDVGTVGVEVFLQQCYPIRPVGPVGE